MKIIKIYTDGGHRRKSKVGAFSYIILINGVEVKRFAKAVPDVDGVKITNNTMELAAVIEAFKELNRLMSNGLKASQCVVYLWTDSQYVQLGLTDWIDGWIEKNWVKPSGKPVKNRAQWLYLNSLYNNLLEVYKSINVQWVEGHNGDEWNEEADRLCNEAMDQYLINKDE